MIKKLKRNLYFLFVSSLLIIFSVAFILLIRENLIAKRNAELAYFNRMISILVLQMEHQENYGAYLALYEEKLGMSFQLSSDAGERLYQSQSLDDDLVHTFLSTQQKTEGDFTFNPSSLTQEHYYSRQGGVFTIRSMDDKQYYCVSCLIITDYNAVYTLITTKEYASHTALLKPILGYYMGIWCFVLLSLLFLSKILVEKAVKPTESAMQSQKDFIAAVSHECKEPLAAILSCAEVMGAIPDAPDDVQKQIHTIDSEVTRMSKLIQELLLLSSLDAGNWSFHMTEIDIDTLMINLYEKFEPVCKKNSLRLQLKLPEICCPPLFSDEDRLTQLFGIFLDNAVTYSNPESEILLQASVVKDIFVVSIIDHGTGISDQDKPFIFNRFYQCDKSHTKKEHFGLGLSIANELVSKLNGKIQLLDTKGGGCTFKIFLPFKDCGA